MGYHQAGFEVVGVDIAPQRTYPFDFHQADALQFVKEAWQDFDVIHASPPCQRYSNAQRIRHNDHPDLVAPTRSALEETGLPFIIENVMGAPLKNPIMLCGAMFGIETYRHRLFEFGGGLTVPEPPHPEHVAKTTKMGRWPQPGEYMHIVGNFCNVDRARKIMEMPWANRDGLREAIPVSYSRYIGKFAFEEWLENSLS